MALAFQKPPISLPLPIFERAIRSFLQIERIYWYDCSFKKRTLALLPTRLILPIHPWYLATALGHIMSHQMVSLSSAKSSSGSCPLHSEPSWLALRAPLDILHPSPTSLASLLPLKYSMFSPQDLHICCSLCLKGQPGHSPLILVFVQTSPYQKTFSDHLI